MKDSINPKHYKSVVNGIDLDEINHLQVINPDFAAYCHGNIYKYTVRAYRKHDSPLEDIKKVRRYCDFMINHLEGRVATTSVENESLKSFLDELNEQERDLVEGIYMKEE